MPDNKIQPVPPILSSAPSAGRLSSVALLPGWLALPAYLLLAVGPNVRPGPGADLGDAQLEQLSPRLGRLAGRQDHACRTKREEARPHPHTDSRHTSSMRSPRAGPVRRREVDMPHPRTGVGHCASDDGHELLEVVVVHGVRDVQGRGRVLGRLHPEETTQGGTSKDKSNGERLVRPEAI